MTASRSGLPAIAGEMEARAAERLAGARCGADICRMMAELTALAEEALDRAIDPEERERIACRGGCAACCVVNVAVLLPEAIAVALPLRQTAVNAHLAERIEHHYAKVRWMDDGERIRRAVSCLFLDGRGMCAIHPVRPFVCRALTSADPDQCRRALDSYGWEEEEPILMNVRQKFIMDEAFRGVGNALETVGMDQRSMELTRAVRGIIAHPSLVDDFLAGKRVSADPRFD